MHIEIDYYGKHPDDGLPYAYVECQRDNSEPQPSNESVHGHITGGIDWNVTNGTVSAWSTTVGAWEEQDALSTKSS